jgi:hypothetical protein
MIPDLERTRHKKKDWQSGSSVKSTCLAIVRSWVQDPLATKKYIFKTPVICHTSWNFPTLYSKWHCPGPKQVCLLIWCPYFLFQSLCCHTLQGNHVDKFTCFVALLSWPRLENPHWYPETQRTPTDTPRLRSNVMSYGEGFGLQQSAFPRISLCQYLFPCWNYLCQCLSSLSVLNTLWSDTIICSSL